MNDPFDRITQQIEALGRRQRRTQLARDFLMYGFLFAVMVTILWWAK